MRNQFAIHLLFSTKSEKDLRALKAINELLPYVATELKDHHFTDAAMRELHEAIPIYTADISAFKDYAETYVSVEDKPVQRQETSLQGYADRLLAALEIEASWPNKLAKAMAKQENKEVDYCKAIVSKALHKLEREGTIAREKIALGDKEVTLYYRKDSSMSGLHKFMEREVTKKLEERGITYELAKQGEDKPNIMTKDFDVEIETGLKNDIKVFVQRLSAKSKIYVIVPNEAEKERYQKIISNPEVVITQLNGVFKIL